MGWQRSGMKLGTSKTWPQVGGIGNKSFKARRIGSIHGSGRRRGVAECSRTATALKDPINDLENALLL